LLAAFAAAGKSVLTPIVVQVNNIPSRERRAALGTQVQRSRDIFELVAAQIISASWEKPDDTRLEDIKRNNIKAWEDPR
jgi:hypothetical protein